jgi:hypothetical protein
MRAVRGNGRSSRATFHGALHLGVVLVVAAGEAGAALAATAGGVDSIDCAHDKETVEARPVKATAMTAQNFIMPFQLYHRTLECVERDL